MAVALEWERVWRGLGDKTVRTFPASDSLMREMRGKREFKFTLRFLSCGKTFSL